MLSADEHCSLRHIGTALEPTLLVELLVVRQESLRHKTEYFASLHDCSTIEQGSTIGYRQTNNADDVEASRSVHQVDERHLCLVEQELLSEEVATRVCSKREFGQAYDFYTFTFCLNDERLYLLDVVLAVCNLHRRNGRRNFDKSVIHMCDLLSTFFSAKIQII